MTAEDKMHSRLVKHLEAVFDGLNKEGEATYEIVGIFNQGSQNYGMDHEGSDVDTITVVVPTLFGCLIEHDFTKVVSVITDDGKTEYSKVMTLQHVYGLWRKGNPVVLECFIAMELGHAIVSTCLGTFMESLDKNRLFKESAFISAAMGMMQAKYSSMDKGTEATNEFFNEFGYNNKDLLHILRLEEMIVNFVQDHRPWYDCYGATNHLIRMRGSEISKTFMNLQTAKAEATLAIQHIGDLKNSFTNPEIDLIDDSQYVQFLKELSKK